VCRATLRRLLAVLVAGGIAAGLVLLIGDLAAVVPAVGAVVIAAFGACWRSSHWPVSTGSPTIRCAATAASRGPRPVRN
jgi:hypothetical protein